MNIHEDLQREEVAQPAKGVVFDGFRLSPPGQRATQFTDKCISAAQSSRTALLPTSELFKAVQYLADQPDPAYAERCRQAILIGSGIIDLPSPPAAATVSSDSAA
jgi:hypothetical protein